MRNLTEQAPHLKSPNFGVGVSEEALKNSLKVSKKEQEPERKKDMSKLDEFCKEIKKGKIIQPNNFANEALTEFHAINESKNVRNLTSSEDARIKKQNKRNSNKANADRRYKDETVLPNLKIKKPDVS